MTNQSLSPPKENDSLDEIILIAADVGCRLMETGSSARQVEENVLRIVEGLGARHMELRTGYASLSLTATLGLQTYSRMRKVSPHGVNQRLGHRIQLLARQVEQGSWTTALVREELDRLISETPRYPVWVTALAVGLACTAFGRLLGIDLEATGPVFFASTLAQGLRSKLHAAGMNMFVSATLVAFVSALFCGLGSRLLHSTTLETAMIASVLLLVPGIPSINAQIDTLEGRPTLGSARAITVTVILAFSTAGLWLAQFFLAKIAS
jgi:uncharacterized membrane protein YjjP (DUF1212 family)